MAADTFWLQGHFLTYYFVFAPSQADILMVTDGEISAPSQDILDRLGRAREEMGLEVHPLLPGRCRLCMAPFNWLGWFLRRPCAP